MCQKHPPITAALLANVSTYSTENAAPENAEPCCPHEGGGEEYDTESCKRFSNTASYECLWIMEHPWLHWEGDNDNDKYVYITTN